MLRVRVASQARCPVDRMSAGKLPPLVREDDDQGTAAPPAPHLAHSPLCGAGCHTPLPPHP
eukprot:gene10903-9535_t